MKYLILTLTLLAPLPALAGGNESPIKGTGPFSVVRNGEPAGTDTPTVEDINSALAFFGRPSLGTSRVLSEGNDAGVSRSEIKILSR